MNEISKVFVIGLKNMPERWRVTEAHLKSLGLNPKIFLGMYGKDSGLVSTKDLKSNLYFTLTPNRIALALNHWCLWNHIALSDDISSAIIFEDDILLPNNFSEFFDATLKQTPEDWDLVYLSTLYPERMIDGRMGVRKVAASVWQYVRAMSWDGACDGTYAYMVSKKGVQKMVEHPFTLNEPIDRWMSFVLLPRMQSYIWHPSPVRTRDAWTSTTQYEF